jgi:hypothetical protein
MTLPFRGRLFVEGSGIPEETLNAVGICGAVDIDLASAEALRGAGPASL